MKNVYLDSSVGLSLIILIFILVFFLVMSVILILKGKKEERISKEQTLFSWIEKKDILYWLLIVCLGAISVITYEYSGDKDALSHWSFAGTIVSIILAVVAIGFTLFQTLASNLSSEKISISAEKIEKASAGLDSDELVKAGKIISDVSTNLLGVNKQLQDQVYELHEKIKAFETEQKTYNSKLDSLFDNHSKSNLKSNENLFNLSEIDFLEKVYWNAAVIPQFYMYSLFRFSEAGIQVSQKLYDTFLEELSQYYFNNVNLSQHDEKYILGANKGSWGSTIHWMELCGYDKNTGELPDPIKSALKNNGLEFFNGDKAYMDFLEEFIKKLQAK
ncbi:hypothetical protein [Metabacillus fastidiosus]|uniref:hypothetical protein n=1 Tax=Metabacillus fastidiosus TaxID=1458 RepID=UPI003D2D3E7C